MPNIVRTNDDSQKILPLSEVWIPHIDITITSN